MDLVPGFRAVLAASLVGLAAAAAEAQTYKQVIPGGDTVTGEITGASDVDRFPFRLVEGTKLTLTVKAGKGSLLKPEVTLLGIDRDPDSAANPLLVKNSKGTQVALKKYLVPDTGLRYIEIRGDAGTTGTWILTGKVTLPKGFAGTGTAVGAGPATSIEFTAPGNATASITVAAAKGSLALPVLDGLKDPKGAELNIDYEVATKKGFTVKGVPLPEPGKHILRVKSGTSGGFTVKIKWKVLKPVKKTITEAQVITDPVPTAVDPSSGDVSETFPVTVDVDFAAAGAKVTFRKGSTAITLPAASVAVDDDSATFNIILSSFQKGTYDVEIENPDGGKGVLPAAFTVVLSPAQIDSVSPSVGYENQTAAVLTVFGRYMNTGATIELSRSGDTIVGTGVAGVATALQATFDLTGHAWGFWDCTVTNPGVVPTTLATAFEIRNALPQVLSIDPADNRSGLVVDCTIIGAEFDETPTVVLRKSGSSDMVGTDVVWVADDELTATFDTTGALSGKWDVVVKNPDDGEGVLEDAFGIPGPVGSPTQVMSAVYDFDGTPSIVYNSALDEFAVAWVDENSSSYDVYIQKLDPEGNALGTRVAVSTASANVPKRDAVVGWDSTNNQYLVAWAELSTNASAVPFLAVFAQRFSAPTLATLSSANVKVSDHSLVLGWYIDAFNNYRPDVCWDAAGGVWQIIWQQEWSVAADDFDINQRTLGPTGDVLGTVAGTSTSPQHESEPSIAYNTSTSSVGAVWNYRSSSAGTLNIVRSGNAAISADTENQKDPDITVDRHTGLFIITWTKAPSSGPMSVQGATFSSGLSKVGSVVDIGTGTEDHFIARSTYNPYSKEVLFGWTRKDSSGGLTVRSRRADTGGGAGLSLIGTEYEASSGSTNEAMAFVSSNSRTGETILFWLKSMGFASQNAYSGGLFNGIYRGKQIWHQRYQ